MIGTEFLKGQGLGNRLFCYISARCIALDRGEAFATAGGEFLNTPHLDLDMGVQIGGDAANSGGPVLSDFARYDEAEERIFLKTSPHDMLHGCYISGADPVLLGARKESGAGSSPVPDGGNEKAKAAPRAGMPEMDLGGAASMGSAGMEKEKSFPAGNILLYGNLQSEEYFRAHREEVRAWLRVKQEFESDEFTADDLCILNLRGGEYRDKEELFLRRRYWLDAMAAMRRDNASMRFMTVTDDVAAARALLPEIPAFHFTPEKDYVTLKNARYLILSNSSFAFFPAYTSDTVRRVIAPKYWARHNVSDGYWASEQNIYDAFEYLDREGKLWTVGECRRELAQYRAGAAFAALKERGPWAEDAPERLRLIRAGERRRRLRRAGDRIRRTLRGEQ